MLVLDPKKRYTISQVRHHKWMQKDGGAPKERPRSPILGQNARIGEYNEQILRLMQGLGIDQQKTVEVSDTRNHDRHVARGGGYNKFE